MSRKLVSAFYLSLADRPVLPLPPGTYTGTVLGPCWLTRILGGIWHGKVFDADGVINRLGPWHLVRGAVSLGATGVILTYGYGLHDECRLLAEGRYLGRFYWRAVPLLSFVLVKAD